MGVRLRTRALGIVATAVALTLVLSIQAAAALDPVYEATHYSKTTERARIYSTPEYQSRLRTISLQNRVEAMRIAASDPERNFLLHLCAGNMFSRYHRSRLDITLADGGRFDCEDFRPDPMRPEPPSTCPAFVPRAQDGWPGEYDYVAIATSPDR